MKQNGYRPSYKNRWLLVTGGILTLQQWALYEYLIDVMDWDPRHDNFGLLEFFPDEMVEVFHKSSESIGDWFRCLVNKRFVRLCDKKRKLYRIKNPERYVFGKASQHELSERNISVEKLLENICFSENDRDNSNISQEKIPIIHESHTWSSASKALSSFRDSLGYETKQVGRTTEEYREIYREGGYSLLLPEDMRWIDENQHFETRPIYRKDEDLSDQDLADVFYEGNMEKYSSYLKSKYV